VGDRWRVDGVTRGPLMMCGCDGGASGDQRWVVLCALHAAAPDLMAALQDIVAGVDPYITAGVVPASANVDPLYQRALAAIAKARGEA